MLLGQCADCRVPPHGLPTRVLTSLGGSVFHRNADCVGFREGQAYAVALGYDNHPLRSVPANDALAEGRGACIVCFPDFRSDERPQRRKDARESQHAFRAATH